MRVIPEADYGRGSLTGSGGVYRAIGICLRDVANFTAYRTGLLTGLVLGGCTDRRHYGRDAGAGVYRLFLRWRSIPPDVVTGGILGVAFAITSGAGTETALLLGLPIATLALILKNIYLGMFIPMLSQRADGYAERADRPRH